MASSQDDIRRIRQIALDTAAKISAAKLGIPTPPKSQKAFNSTMPGDVHDRTLTPPPLPMPEPGLQPQKKYRKTATAEAVHQLMIEVEKQQAGGGTYASSAEPVACISHMQIPEVCVGFVIGKKGEGIKQFESHYGVCIQITESSDKGMKSMALVGGTPDAQAKVRAAIGEMVEQKQAKLKPEVVQTFEVPERFCGFLVGKKGEFLKQVCHRTGVKVELDQAPRPGEVKAMTVKGSQEAVARARDIFDRQTLEAYRRAGIFNAPLETKFADCPGSIADMLAAPLLVPPVQPPLAPSREGGVAFDGLVNAAIAASPPCDDVTPSLAGPPPPPPLPHSPCVRGPPNQLGFGRLADTEKMRTRDASLMEIDTVEDGSSAYYEVIQRWAVHYARDPACVAYYTSLRSQAAQALSGEVLAASGGA